MSELPLDLQMKLFKCRSGVNKDGRFFGKISLTYFTAFLIYHFQAHIPIKMLLLKLKCFSQTVIAR